MQMGHSQSEPVRSSGQTPARMLPTGFWLPYCSGVILELTRLCSTAAAAVSMIPYCLRSGCNPVRVRMKNSVTDPGFETAFTIKEVKLMCWWLCDALTTRAIADKKNVRRAV